jgi:uncharacterized membrane protein YfcA
VGIASVGGIGGGIVKLPVLVLIMEYGTSLATSLTYPITLGKHKHKNLNLFLEK